VAGQRSASRHLLILFLSRARSLRPEVRLTDAREGGSGASKTRRRTYPLAGVPFEGRSADTRLNEHGSAARKRAHFLTCWSVRQPVGTVGRRLIAPKTRTALKTPTAKETPTSRRTQAELIRDRNRMMGIMSGIGASAQTQNMEGHHHHHQFLGVAGSDSNSDCERS
jgi:hypothetical protein